MVCSREHGGGGVLLWGCIVASGVGRNRNVEESLEYSTTTCRKSTFLQVRKVPVVVVHEKLESTTTQYSYVDIIKENSYQSINWVLRKLINFAQKMILNILTKILDFGCHTIAQMSLKLRLRVSRFKFHINCDHLWGIQIISYANLIFILN